MQSVNALPSQTIELNDIHIPEQISNFPFAYGWWLLAILIMLFITLSIIKIRKHVKQNAIKKQALYQLMNSPEQSINNTIALLKWTAMHYFSRAQLAKLFGDSLHQFLISTLPSKHQEAFTALSKQGFLNQYKNPNNNNDDQISDSANKQFTQAAKLWLTHALPPKEVKASQLEKEQKLQKAQINNKPFTDSKSNNDGNNANTSQGVNS